MKIRLLGADGRTDRQTGRHDEANSRFSQFYEKRLKRLSLLDAAHPFLLAQKINVQT